MSQTIDTPTASRNASPVRPPALPLSAPKSIPPELIARGEAAQKAVEMTDAAVAQVMNDCNDGIDFIGQIAKLRVELDQLRSQSTPVAEIVAEPIAESRFGEALGVARRLVGRPQHVFDNNASNLLAYQRELALWGEFFESCYILREIVQTNKDWQRVITVLASKGGAGKTPLITHLAAIFAFATSTTNLLLEGNENDGTVNLRYNLPRDSQALLNDVVANHELIKDHVTATATLGKFAQACVWVLLSAANSSDNAFTMTEFLSMFDTARPHFGNVWGDTGNGNRGAANEGLFLKADVELFPAMANDPGTWSTIITTMINLYQAGYVKKLQERSFIVINATTDEHSVAMFVEKFREIAAVQVKPRYDYKTDTHDKAPLWTVDPDQLLRDLGFKFDEKTQKFTGEGIFMVRFSDWVSENNVVSVRPEDTGLETIVDYLKILVACFLLPTEDTEHKEGEITRRTKDRAEMPTLPLNPANSEANLAFTPEAMQQFAKEIADKVVEMGGIVPTEEIVAEQVHKILHPA